MEKVFVIIKPDAIAEHMVGWVIDKFEEDGLSVVKMLSRQRDVVWCNQHYRHLDSEIYKRVEPFMLSGTLIGIIFEGDNAVEIARQVAGDTFNPVWGTIRFKAPGPPHENRVHVSDSAHNTQREIALFWR